MRDALAVLLFAALAACPSQAGPNDEAMAAYLQRHDIGTHAEDGAADVRASSGPALADAPPAPGPSARRVALTVERATGLPDLDVGPGTTDAYVVLDYEGQRHRTSVIEGDLEPVWGDTYIIDVRPGGVLMVRLMDEDSLASDEQLGTVSQVLPDLQVGETRTLTLSFRNGAGGALTLTLTGMVRP